MALRAWRSAVPARRGRGAEALTSPSLRAVLPVGARRALDCFDLPVSQGVERSLVAEPAVPSEEEGGPHPRILDPETPQDPFKPRKYTAPTALVELPDGIEVGTSHRERQ